MNIALLKRALRWVSGLLVVDRGAYYVYCHSSDAGTIVKCQHYLPNARYLLFRDYVISDDVASLRKVATPQWLFLVLNALFLGRILIFDCGRLARLLQS